MRSEIKFSIFFIVCFIPGFRLECKISIEDVDKCGTKSMFFGNRDAIIPTSDQEMDQHCSDTRNGIHCMRDYATNCITGFPQQIFGIILTNAGLHMDKRCNKPKERQEFMEHVKCLIPKEKKEPLNICSDKHIVMMERVKDLGGEERIPASCCSFHLLRDCIVQNSKTICGDGTAQYWDDIIDEIAEESITFACDEYDSLAKCEKLMPANLWQPFKDIAKTNDASLLAARHKYHSVITVILEIIEKYKM